MSSNQILVAIDEEIARLQQVRSLLSQSEIDSSGSNPPCTLGQEEAAALSGRTRSYCRGSEKEMGSSKGWKENKQVKRILRTVTGQAYATSQSNETRL